MATDLNAKWMSEVGQDAFAYDSTGQKSSGTFLDLGAGGGNGGDDRWDSNSFSLERIGWKGLLVESDPKWEGAIKAHRATPYIIAPAESIDWASVLPPLGLGPVIDYLSLDVEGAELQVLQNLHEAGFKFRVITCEHNAYSSGDRFREPQREYLLSQGYALTVPDVRTRFTDLVFEDWWTGEKP